MGPAVKLYAQWKPITAQIIDSNGTSAVREYISLADAVEAYDGNGYIKMTANTEEPGFTLDRDVILDLNGKTVKLFGDLTVAEGKTLYGMDSSSKADYTTAPSGKIVGTVKGCAPTYQTPGDTNNRYVAILSEENGTSTLSFHRFNISVTGYRFELKAPECALFFIGKFQGDKAAKDYLSKLGFTLKGNNDKPLGEDNYELPAGKDIPPEAEPGDSPVVRSADDAFLFEVYLKRSFEKDKPDTAYTEKITATAQAMFKNNGTQDSEPKQWSFEDAWTNPGELDETQQAILDKFLKALNIPNP